MSDRTPCQYTSVTVTVVAKDAGGAPVSGASVSSTWQYRTTTSYEDGVTGGDGVARLTRQISRATPGHEVDVHVTATKDGMTAHASTSFTPRDC